MNPLEARKLITVVKTPQKFSHRVHPTENYRLPFTHFMESHITRAQLHQPPMTNAPSLSESMDINTYGLHLLLHNRPGSVSLVSGP